MNGLAGRQVTRRDDNVLAELCHGARMFPCLADVFEPAHHVGRKSSFPGRGSIEDQVAMPAIERLKPLVHHGRHGLKLAIRVRLFPEPPIRKGHTGEGRKVTVLGNLLPRILFIRFDIGIVESAGRILTGVEVAEEAVGLETLDVLVDLVERDLFIRNAAPRSIPSISDEDVDLSIAGE